MNPKQERFVAEYLIDMNATQAAIRSGYSAKTAEQQGPRLLGNAGVKAAIAAGRKRLSQKLNLTAESVLADIDRIGRKAEAANEFHPALKARELLGKHLKLFTDKIEHGGIGGGAIVLHVTATDENL